MTKQEAIDAVYQRIAAQAVALHRQFPGSAMAACIESATMEEVLIYGAIGSEADPSAPGLLGRSPLASISNPTPR